MEGFNEVTIAAIDDYIRSEVQGHYRPNPEELMALRVRHLFYELTRSAVAGISDGDTRSFVMALNRKWETLVLELLRIPPNGHIYVQWHDGLLTRAEFDRARADANSGLCSVEPARIMGT